MKGILVFAASSLEIRAKPNLDFYYAANKKEFTGILVIGFRSNM